MNTITKPIPLRITEGMAQIEAAAKKLKTNRSRIIVFATLAFVEFADRNDPITMPPNWSEILGGKPGRRKKG